MKKEVYKQKCFFSIITKKLNWKILIKNLVTVNIMLILWGFPEKCDF